MYFKILKLTNKCKFEYLPSHWKYFQHGRCAVIGSEVWLCFAHNRYSLCDTWTHEKTRKSLIFYHFFRDDGKIKF